jgi:flagellar basal-body rod protein FlgB
MAVGDLDLMGALKTRMQWHQARQRLLAENVANANTPHFKAKDLKAPVLPGPTGSASGTPGAMRAPAVTLAATQAGHIATGSPRGFRTDSKPHFEVTPSGNAVDLEDQMAKSAENQLDYQTVSSLYQQSLTLIRTAIGKK